MVDDIYFAHVAAIQISLRYVERFHINFEVRSRILRSTLLDLVGAHLAQHCGQVLWRK